MKKSLKILIISVAYPSEIDPLNGSFVEDFAQCISSIHDVTVLHCTVVNKTKEISNEIQIVNQNGIKTIHIFIHKSYLPWTISVTLGFNKGINFLKKSNIEFDLIHAHFFISALPFLFKKSKVPLILTEHWSGFPLNQLSISYKILAKLVMRKCKKVIPVSNFLKKSIVSKGIDFDFQIIPNPVDEKIFFNKEKNRNENINIILIARMVPIKNIPTVLNAIKKVTDNKQNIHFNIIGDGPNFNEYYELSHKLCLSKNLTFHGKKSKIEIANFLQNCDFVMISSLVETQSVVFNEATSCGKPVLASNRGALKELVNEKNGILVNNPEDVNEWVEKINFMINNFTKFSSSMIEKISHEQFSFPVICNQYNKTYEKIINE